MAQIQRIPRSRPSTAPRPQAPAGEPLPAIRQRAWFVHRWAPGVPLMHVPVAVRLRGPLDVDALRTAVGTLVAQLPALCSAVQPGPTGPVAVLQEGTPELRVLPGDTSPAAARAAALAACDRLADLAAVPPFDATLLVGGPDEHVLVLVTHRVAVDEWSVAALLDRLAAAYAGIDRGPAPFAPDREPGGPDYWTRHLDGLSELELDLLVDTTTTTTITTTGSRWVSGVEEGRYGPELRRAVDALAERTGTDRRAVLLAGCCALLARYTGTDDVVVGSLLPGLLPDRDPDLIGSYANPVALRLAVPPRARFADLVAAAARTLRGADAHHDIPFQDVVRALGAAGNRTGQPLFPAAVQLDLPPLVSAEWAGGVRAEQEPVDLGVTATDLSLRLDAAGDGLAVTVTYSAVLVAPDRAHRLVGHLGEVLRSGTADPDRRVAELSVLDPAERRQVLVDWNATDVDHGAADRCVHELVEEQAARDGGHEAIRFEDSSITYAELDQRSNQLARYLVEAGVGPERVVAVMVERGPTLPLSILGILKAGGAYLPLDPEHPADRVAFQLADAASTVVVTTTEFAGRLPESVRTVPLDDPVTAAALDALDTGSLGRIASPDNLAYIIFTSGSTGRPKGVQIAHRAVVGYVRCCRQRYRMGPADRVMQFNNPCFDPSVFDFFAALTSGSTLIQAPNSVLHGSRSLAGLMHAEHVTFADLPPIIPQLLDPAAVPELRSLNCGGEALPGDVVDRWQAPGREIWNTYGPTEATVVCTDYLCPPDRSQPRTPIGRPMDNTQAYVVDENFEPVPVGVPGELLIGGIQLARGYLNRRALTAERFVPDPFGPPGGRLYRTGDVARWLPSGDLDFLGRIDRQIKLHGHRIEPGEVEGAILAHPDVKQAAVDVHHTTGNLGDLVAYLVPAAGATVPTAVELRPFLQGRLPAYFIPNRVVVLDALPLTPNGKVDRRALPTATEPASGGAGSTGGPLHGRIAALWQEVLGVAEVGPEDDFFALGGDSVRAAVVLARLRASLGIDTELAAFFAEPTPAALAAAAARQVRGSRAQAGMAVPNTFGVPTPRRI